MRAARYTMKSMVTNGVLNNEGSGDNALFKGIFVRYAMNVWKDASVDKADAGLRADAESARTEFLAGIHRQRPPGLAYAGAHGRMAHDA